jgi:hypothetical protein
MHTPVPRRRSRLSVAGTRCSGITRSRIAHRFRLKKVGASLRHLAAATTLGRLLWSARGGKRSSSALSQHCAFFFPDETLAQSGGHHVFQLRRSCEATGQARARGILKDRSTRRARITGATPSTDCAARYAILCLRLSRRSRLRRLQSRPVLRKAQTGRSIRLIPSSNSNYNDPT